MAKQKTNYVWTGLEGRIARETEKGALIVPAPEFGIEEFWAPLAELDVVLYRDGTWQRSGPLKLNKPFEDLKVADWVAKQRGLA